MLKYANQYHSLYENSLFSVMRPTRTINNRLVKRTRSTVGMRDIYVTNENFSAMKSPVCKGLVQTVIPAEWHWSLASTFSHPCAILHLQNPKEPLGPLTGWPLPRVHWPSFWPDPFQGPLTLLWPQVKTGTASLLFTSFGIVSSLTQSLSRQLDSRSFTRVSFCPIRFESCKTWEVVCTYSSIHGSVIPSTVLLHIYPLSCYIYKVEIQIITIHYLHHMWSSCNSFFRCSSWRMENLMFSFITTVLAEKALTHT